MSEFLDELTWKPYSGWKENVPTVKKYKDSMSPQELLEDFLSWEKSKKIRLKRTSSKIKSLLRISSKYIKLIDWLTTTSINIDSSEICVWTKSTTNNLVSTETATIVDQKNLKLLVKEFIKKFQTLEREQKEISRNNIQSTTNEILEKIKKI